MRLGLSTFVSLSLGVVFIVAPARSSADDAWVGLSAPERAQVAEAIDAVRQDGSRRAVDALRARITEGLPPVLLDRAVDTLIAIGRGPASRALLGLARHRRVQVRAKVAGGLVTARAPGARARLVEMLDDASPVVRSAAARALGALGATASMRDLVTAAALGNADAVTVVADQARPSDVTRMLRDVSGDNLEAYAPILRDLTLGDRLPTRTRVAILAHLAEIGTVYCHHFLQEMVGALPEGDPVATAAAESLGEVQAREEEAREAEAARAVEATDAADAAAPTADEEGS